MLLCSSPHKCRSLISFIKRCVSVVVGVCSIAALHDVQLSTSCRLHLSRLRTGMGGQCPWHAAIQLSFLLVADILLILAVKELSVGIGITLGCFFKCDVSVCGE
jgi:hypothetical protein